jgi:pimeloyl-ACP methyl ester carboxylesterase
MAKRRLPRGLGCILALGILIMAGVWILRSIERSLTFSPTKYRAGDAWPVPAGAREVAFQTSDGVKLVGWYFQTPGARRTVLYCHGNAANVAFHQWISRLAQANLNVLLWDYRGFGKSEGRVGDEGTLRLDSEAAYDFLIANGVSPRDMVIYGQSLGSTVAIDLAARRECARLLVESGMSSQAEMARVRAPWIPSFLVPLGRNRFDSRTKIAQVRVPVLVAHGAEDKTIPFVQGQALFQAANQPKQWIEVEGAGHWLPEDARYLQRAIEWMKEP